MTIATSTFTNTSAAAAAAAAATISVMAATSTATPSSIVEGMKNHHSARVTAIRLTQSGEDDPLAQWRQQWQKQRGRGSQSVRKRSPYSFCLHH